MLFLLEREEAPLTLKPGRAEFPTGSKTCENRFRKNDHLWINYCLAYQ